MSSEVHNHYYWPKTVHIHRDHNEHTNLTYNNLTMNCESRYLVCRVERLERTEERKNRRSRCVYRFYPSCFEWSNWILSGYEVVWVLSVGLKCGIDGSYIKRFHNSNIYCWTRPIKYFEIIYGEWMFVCDGVFPNTWMRRRRQWSTSSRWYAFVFGKPQSYIPRGLTHVPAFTYRTFEAINYVRL